MSKIRARWGARIIWACARTAIRPELIAALVASESGGNQNATNLEESILSMFHNILASLPVRWRPLNRNQLERLTGQQITDYATSFGLTQITGYHIYPRDPRELLDPDTSLRETVCLLEDWQKQYKIDPADAEAFLRCWNGGGPHNRTVPGYVENGLAHLRTYELLCGESDNAGPALRNAGATANENTGKSACATVPTATEGGSNAGRPVPATPSASLAEVGSRETAARSKEEKA